MKRGDGFSLIEVVVAGGLLAIGILAVFTLQAQALRAQRRVTVVRELVAVAEAELYERLARRVPTGGSCDLGELTTAVTHCTVEVSTCAGSQDGLCSATESSRASRVEVRVGAGSQVFRLAAIHGTFGTP